MATKRIIELPDEPNPDVTDRLPIDNLTTRSTTLENLVKGLPPFTGDFGSGGAKGVVPAPGAGDATKFLSASGGWETVSPSLPVPQGRLTLSNGNPVADITLGTSVYYTPFKGASIPRYDGADWLVDTFTEMTMSGNAAHATNTNYDVFYFDDGGTKRIGTGPAWSSSSARGTGAGTTELVLLGGFWVNAVSMTVRNGANTYSVPVNRGLYLGTVRTRAAAAGTFEDSKGGSVTPARRYVFNAYNRVPRPILITESAASWSYTTGTWRRMNNNSNMVANFITGLSEDAIDFSGVMSCQSTSTPSNALGYDWTSGAPDTSCLFGFGAAGGAYGTVCPSLRTVPAIGLHTVTALEYGNTGATFYGAGAVSNCGLNGTVMA